MTAVRVWKDVVMKERLEGPKSNLLVILITVTKGTRVLNIGRLYLWITPYSILSLLELY